MSSAFQSNAFQNNAFQTQAPNPPEANFTFDKDSGQSPLLIQFTDNSTNNPTAWLWEYNLNGNNWIAFSTLKNPVHNFISEGRYSIRLTVTNSAGTDQITQNEIINIVDIHFNVIDSFEISNRINEGITNFSIQFNTPLSPDKFRTGEVFEFNVNDNTLDEEQVLVTGVVEGVERKSTDGNKIYSITGRDKARLLAKQPFTLNCNTENPTEYTVMDLLGMILQDTGITFGRGQSSLNKVILLTNDGEASNRFCGEWTSKQEAINALFAQYIRFSGAKTFRWWVDYGGHFRWFEINTPRAGKVYFFENDERIVDFTVKEDSTNVINDLTGFYGDEENQQSVHITNEASISKHGRCIGMPITETTMTREEMTLKVQREIDQKSQPIYTATLVLKDFYTMDNGTQVMLPNDPFYPDIVFTISDYKISKESKGPRRTYINLTTDDSVISLPNEFEVIQAIAQKEVEDNKAMVGVVTSVPDEGSSSDRCQVWLQTGGGSGGSGVVASVRNVGGNFITS